MSPKQRLDVRVAAERDVSRAKAAAMIMAGIVSGPRGPLRKPGQLVSSEDALTFAEGSGTVSRAAGKLIPVLEKWQIDAKDTIALDVGSSTGGFTEALLDRGATKVYAVDV